MGAFMAFAPFIAFSLVEKTAGPVPGLAAGALMSVALLVRDRLRGQREINILEMGSALMFGSLAVLALIGDPEAWTLWRVRLWVDTGLLLIVAFSLAVRRPFTMHHARRRVSPDVARTAAFLRANDVLSGVWALAFAGLIVADALMVWWPETPVSIAVALTLASLAGAAAFTGWYAGRLKARRSQLEAGAA